MRARRRLTALVALVTLGVGAGAIAAAPAGATSVPGMPGTPVATAISYGATLQWSAPADPGSPPLAGYRIEANDGSGWSPVSPERGATAIAGGLNHTCAVLDDGSVRCWGDDRYGQLGLGDTQWRGDDSGEMGDALPAVALGTGRTALAIATGSDHTCALLDDHTVKCWGRNDRGQLGLGDTANRGDDSGEMGDALPAVALGAGRTALAIATGSLHTCALLDDHTVKCWGSNLSGESGQGDTVQRGDGPGEMGDALPAIALGTGRTAVAITAGGNDTCALLDNDTVKCWGSNVSGRLGLGNTANRGDGPGEMGNSLPAVALGTGRTALAIAAGSNFVCAVLDNHALKCWGANAYGQLGQGDTAIRGDIPGEMGDSLPPVALGTGRTVVKVTAGAFHACALLDDASVKCWGQNGSGQLGVDDSAPRGDAAGEMGDALPSVALGAGRTAVAVATGFFHSCAVLDDAALKCWGDNTAGKLGLGDGAARGDNPGEMGDSLPAVALGTVSGVGTTSAVIRLALGTFQFRVIAENIVGDGAPSAASAPVTVAHVPDAPTGVAGTPGGFRANVTWVAPANDGGSSIVDYEVTVLSATGDAPMGVNGATTRAVGSAATSFAFTGLTNGNSYSFRVAAVNAIGTGEPSARSATVVPQGLPSAPGSIGAAPGNGSATVTWSPSIHSAREMITNYRVSVFNSSGGPASGVTGGTWRLVGASPFSSVFTGLTNGTTYRFRVAAVNSVGTGPSTPFSIAVIAGAPAAPGNVKARPGAATAATGSLIVSFSAAANHGSAITRYTATCTSTNGGATRSASGTKAPLTVTATTGKTYECTARATNARGAGPLSFATLPVVVGAPAPPTSVVAVRTAAGRLRVTFTAGANHGSAITSYTAACQAPESGVYNSASGPASPLTVVDLTAGSSYTCTVTATNARGASPESTPSAPVTA